MQEKEEFKIGDVVTLKSGGVKMTIIEVYASDVDCLFWIESTGVFDQKEFRKEWLMKAGD